MYTDKELSMVRLVVVLAITGGVLLSTASIAKAQLGASRIPSVSVRDRLMQPKIGTPSAQIDALLSTGAPNGLPQTIDGTRASRPVGNPSSTANRGLTIPYWSDSFSYLGLTYKYSMAGTDPKRGSATTIIPTVIIPVRFVFENGYVSDAATDLLEGETSIQGMINSPIFQNYDFVSGGTHVGNTQYGDAFQRANFWNSVSRKSPDYHVLLAQPTVAPTYEVFVPNSLVTFIPEGNGRLLPIIEDSFMQQATNDALAQANISPQKLAIVDWGDVTTSLVAGWHRERSVAGGIQTYIASGYHARIPFFRLHDTAILSHEVIEWMDDPFGDNFTPGWDPVFNSYPHCLSDWITGDELEVGDVFEFTTAGFIELNTVNGIYQLQEGAFIDYFTRSNTSRSVNGQYSFFGVSNSPSADCAGHLEIQATLIEFPNAPITVALGINDHGQIVGIYWDQSYNVHGFTYDHGQYAKLDYPGSIETDLNGINNTGQVCGYYLDIFGLPHGFVYSQGTFYPVNFPGAPDTAAYGINSRGDIVGAYDDTSAITHGFAFQNGQFRTVDTPFSSQSLVTSINDRGHMVGYLWNDPSDPIRGFIFGPSGFSRFDFPAAAVTAPNAINNQDEHGGAFVDFNGAYGYVTISGRPYALYYYVLGMNNQNQIVGNAFNQITNRRVGFVATLPTAGP